MSILHVTGFVIVYCRRCKPTAMRLLSGYRRCQNKAGGFCCEPKNRPSRFSQKGGWSTAKNEFVLEQALLQECPPWVFYEVIRRILIHLGIGLRRFKQEHFDSIRQLIREKKAKAEFPGGVEVVVEKATVHIQLKQQPPEVLAAGIGYA